MPRVFYALLANTLLASVTNFTVWFAITFFVFLETHSVFATSIVAGLYLVLVAVSGFWFGSLVDHHRKKRAMLASSAASFVLYLAGLANYLAAGPGEFKDVASVRLWLLVPVLLLGVIAGNVRTISLSTAITILIPEDRRDRANGLAGTATGVSFLITSVISGVLVGASGMFWVLVLALLTTGLAFGHLATMSIPEPAPVAATHAPRRIDVRGTLAAIGAIPGLFALILFATFNNFLGGVYMSLMDAYGLSLVSVQVWGFLWGVLSIGFILGGLLIARRGLGRNPVRTILAVNVVMWTITSVFALRSSIALLGVGMFIYLTLIPFVEASEQTVIQRLVPPERQGRVFGLAQSVEMAASPLTAFFIGPIAQFFFIPFMTTGAGVRWIGSWFGTGPDRGLALVFTLAGLVGLAMTVIALRSRYYRQLSASYLAMRVEETDSAARMPQAGSPAIISNS